jgi:hypothetical protein
MRKERFYGFLIIANGIMLALFLGVLLVSGASTASLGSGLHPALFWGGAMVNLLLVSGAWLIIDVVLWMWFRRKYKKSR